MTNVSDQCAAAVRSRFRNELVFDLGGHAAGYRVQYVDELGADGSGEPVPLRGGACLQIIVAATIVDEQGHVGYGPGDGSRLVVDVAHQW